MQTPLVTRENAAPKRRLGIVSAVVVCSIAAVLPVRVRIVFTFAINFVYNHVLATARLLLAVVGRWFTRGMIFLAYFLAVGPAALAARALGGDYLDARGRPRYWAKEPPDGSRQRFQRQF
jgi:hypothetical protein